MNVETLQIPALVTIIIAFAVLLALPLAALSGSRVPVTAAVKSSGSSSNASCDLPPVLDGGDALQDRRPGGPPALDLKVPEKFKTATFAMG